MGCGFVCARGNGSGALVFVCGVGGFDRGNGSGALVFFCGVCGFAGTVGNGWSALTLVLASGVPRSTSGRVGVSEDAGGCAGAGAGAGLSPPTDRMVQVIRS